MTRFRLQLLACLLFVAGGLGTVPAPMALGDEVEVTKIWDTAPHNAFTDLVRWQDKFYCTFREGEHHVHGADGKIRLIASEDGEKWDSVAMWEEPGIDLRDAKLSIMPDGRLMILMGGSEYVDRKLMSCLTRVAFLQPGQREASPPRPVVVDPQVKSNHDWVWRVVWHEGVGYGTLYQIPPSTPDYRLQLLKTTDGVNYELVTTLGLSGQPNEATPLLLDDGTMVMAVRNGVRASFGRSRPPYTEWDWVETAQHLGGPDLELLPGGGIVMGTRAFGDSQREPPYTALGLIARDATFDERVRLPSGGDTSYPGMVVHDGKLWVSYYASHEGKTSIYLAKVPLAALED